jgi:hypothetical protein
MKWIAFLLVAGATWAGLVASSAPAARHVDDNAAPIYGIKLPPGYRDWRLISVAHEEGNLNDLRAILGNDAAINAYRKENFLFLTAQSLPVWLGITSLRRKTTKSLAVNNLSLPGPPRTFNSWSRTQKNTSRPEAGGSLNLGRANLTTRRTSKPASLATSPSKLATSSSTVTHLDT